MISEAEKRRFEEMLNELQSSWLQVDLSPSRKNPRNGRMIRIVSQHNADWYKSFCALYPANRTISRRRKKFDTAIKRKDTERGLIELISGNARSLYARRLLDFIRQEKARYDFDQDASIPGFEFVTGD